MSEAIFFRVRSVFAYEDESKIRFVIRMNPFDTKEGEVGIQP